MSGLGQYGLTTELFLCPEWLCDMKVDPGMLSRPSALWIWSWSHRFQNFTSAHPSQAELWWLFHIMQMHLFMKLNILGYSMLTAFLYSLGHEHHGSEHSQCHCKKDKVHIWYLKIMAIYWHDLVWFSSAFILDIKPVMYGLIMA